MPAPPAPSRKPRDGAGKFTPRVKPPAATRIPGGSEADAIVNARPRPELPIGPPLPGRLGRDPRTRPGAGDLLAVSTPHGPRTWVVLAVFGSPDVHWRSVPAEIRDAAARDLALLKCGPVPEGRASLETFQRRTERAEVLHVEPEPIAEWTAGGIVWHDLPTGDEA